MIDTFLYVNIKCLSITILKKIQKKTKNVLTIVEINIIIENVFKQRKPSNFNKMKKIKKI